MLSFLRLCVLGIGTHTTALPIPHIVFLIERDNKTYRRMPDTQYVNNVWCSGDPDSGLRTFLISLSTHLSCISPLHPKTLATVVFIFCSSHFLVSLSVFALCFFYLLHSGSSSCSELTDWRCYNLFFLPCFIFLIWVLMP